jgi:nitrite reductase/ring-hydroxylating ferredoxin subunit
LEYIITDMDEWVRVAATSELVSEGLGLQVVADGVKIAIFQWDGRLHAVEDLCPHLGFPLSEGIVQNGEVICSWHGWRICLDDGSCRREKIKAKVFPCQVRGDEVWIQI